ncbi:MAG: hypothetical protein L6R36_006005 [Xanthoria steineri]|nr:MAG: hypothetical protein L6R36_006005 [Xanthoria steineri]
MAAQEGDRAPLMLAVFSVFLVLPLVAVALRFLARRVTRVSLWWDDWLLLVAAVLVILNFIFLYETIKNGAGKHIQSEWPPQRLEHFLIYTYANEIIYASIVTCIKSSVLCLYLRVFGIKKKFAILVKCFMVAVITWGIAVLFTTIFQCNPVRGAWDISVPRHQCFNLRTWLIATNVPNIVIDFGIICLPIPLVWKLKLSTERKIGLTGVFLLGFFASIISIVRVHTNASLQIQDPTWNYMMVMIWSTVEGNVGVCEIDTQSLEGTLFLGRLLAASAFRSQVKLQSAGGRRHIKFGVPRELGLHRQIFDFRGGSQPGARVEHDLCLEQCKRREYEETVTVISS